MRRIVIIGTALTVLALAGSAFAASALNTYTASHPVSPNKAGSSRSPIPVSVTDKYTAHNTIAGERTAPLTDIKFSLYGLVSNGKYFPTCSLSKIAHSGDTACPKGALVASGTLGAVIGKASDPSVSAPGTGSCNVILKVWNAGQGKVVYYFHTDASHVCYFGAIHTGGVGPYYGFSRTKHNVYTLDVPIPPYVSFPLSGLQGSLVTETLKWPKKTTKVHGKTVGYLASVACKRGKRPYSTTFTAETAQRGGVRQSTTLSSRTKCSR
ncbi:MAG: hypothetical protein WBP81_37230 [Solirubrobacteraceae bacterium]